jgi:hypothetical protein
MLLSFARPRDSTSSGANASMAVCSNWGTRSTDTGNCKPTTSRSSMSTPWSRSTIRTVGLTALSPKASKPVKTTVALSVMMFLTWSR